MKNKGNGLIEVSLFCSLVYLFRCFSNMRDNDKKMGLLMLCILLVTNISYAASFLNPFNSPLSFLNPSIQVKEYLYQAKGNTPLLSNRLVNSSCSRLKKPLGNQIRHYSLFHGMLSSFVNQNQSRKKWHLKALKKEREEQDVNNSNNNNEMAKDEIQGREEEEVKVTKEAVNTEENVTFFKKEKETEMSKEATSTISLQIEETTTQGKRGTTTRTSTRTRTRTRTKLPNSANMKTPNIKQEKSKSNVKSIDKQKQKGDINDTQKLCEPTTKRNGTSRLTPFTFTSEEISSSSLSPSTPKPIAIVTGSNRGIGNALCNALYESNFQVIATHRSRKEYQARQTDEQNYKNLVKRYQAKQTQVQSTNNSIQIRDLPVRIEKEEETHKELYQHTVYNNNGLSTQNTLKKKDLSVDSMSFNSFSSNKVPNKGYVYQVLDLQESHQVEEFISSISTTTPQINLLINNAGVCLPGTSLEVFLQTLEVNLWAPIRLIEGLIPHLQASSTTSVIENLLPAFHSGKSSLSSDLSSPSISSMTLDSDIIAKSSKDSTIKHHMGLDLDNDLYNTMLTTNKRNNNKLTQINIQKEGESQLSKKQSKSKTTNTSAMIPTVVNISSGDGELCYLPIALADLIRSAQTIEELKYITRELLENKRPCALEDISPLPWPAYTLSKAMLNAATRIFASSSEYKNNIRFIAICPGDVDTDMCDIDANPFSIISPQKAAQDILQVALTTSKSLYPSGYFYRDGKTIPW